MTDQEWGQIIIAGSDEAQIMKVIEAINDLSAKRKAMTGAIMAGCCQILGQSIAKAPPIVAKEVRLGIMSLIDGYATHSAVERTDI